MSANSKLTRPEINHAGGLVAACLYRHGKHTNPSTTNFSEAFAESCPNLCARASDWHFNRVVSAAKREIAKMYSH